MDIIQKIIEFLNYTALAATLTAAGELIIKMLEFFIYTIKWLLAYL